MKGICFKEPLFLATIGGNKTQTRRICRFDKTIPIEVEESLRGVAALMPNGLQYLIRPKYSVGELVYLKEPYYDWDDLDPEDGAYSYKFKDPQKCVPFWRNKLFMPAKAARYFIQIKNVRVERLQDITEEDCIKEGIVDFGEMAPIDRYGLRQRHVNIDLGDTPRTAYAKLIDDISSKGTWESNPFVWVYDYLLFKR